MSYLCYLCLFAHSDVQHILCCVFALFFFVLCTLCCQFLCFSSSCVPYVASFSVFLRLVYPMVPVSLFFFVLCTLWCQFLWIVFVLCTLWCQFLWIVFVLCTLWCQFLWIVFVLCTLWCQFLWIVLF
jgi:hypothetical protein